MCFASLTALNSSNGATVSCHLCQLNHVNILSDELFCEWMDDCWWVMRTVDCGLVWRLKEKRSRRLRKGMFRMKDFGRDELQIMLTERARNDGKKHKRQTQVGWPCTADKQTESCRRASPEYLKTVNGVQCGGRVVFLGQDLVHQKRGVHGHQGHEVQRREDVQPRVGQAWTQQQTQDKVQREERHRHVVHVVQKS